MYQKKDCKEKGESTRVKVRLRKREKGEENGKRRVNWRNNLFIFNGEEAGHPTERIGWGPGAKIIGARSSRTNDEIKKGSMWLKRRASRRKGAHA